MSDTVELITFIFVHEGTDYAIDVPSMSTGLEIKYMIQNEANGVSFEQKLRSFYKLPVLKCGNKVVKDTQRASTLDASQDLRIAYVTDWLNIVSLIILTMCCVAVIISFLSR